MTNDVIENRIDRIALALSKTSNDKTGLLQEDGGKLLFLAYYSKYKQSTIISNIYQKQLLLFCDKLCSGVYNPSYCEGVSGMIFLLDFLNKEKLTELDLSEIKEHYDNYLKKILDIYIDRGENDFLYTSVGLLYYFTNSCNIPDGYLESRISRLAKHSIKMPKGIAWRDNFEKKSEINFNISISHGMAGLIVILVKLQKRVSYDLSPLIKSAIDFVLSQKYKNFCDIGSCYPTYCLDADQEFKSRLGWCNGDLGIGMALWHAGNYFKNEIWIKEAIELFNFNAYRRNEKDTYVKDAGFCHGAAGIAQIYRRLFFETGKELYYNTSFYWIMKTLEFGDDNDFQTGYKTYFQGNFYPSDNSLLSGLSGIGLSLLSFLNSKSYSTWDAIFLLS